MKAFAFVWMVAVLFMCAYQANQGNVARTIFWAMLSIIADKNFRRAKP